MSNKLNLSNYAENNLRTLAAYLLSGKIAATFDMRLMHDTAQEYKFYSHTCGSVGCAVGHGPYAGIPKAAIESWPRYAHRVFNIGSAFGLGAWMFSGFWSSLDNTPQGTAKRILWTLENGIPDNWTKQMTGLAPLCYVNFSIDTTEQSENNLRTLADYLLSGQLKCRFGMSFFEEKTECDTVACAVGHGPYAGIPKHVWESWTDYMRRVFSVHEDSKAYTWLFNCVWSEVDDTPEGAGKRIRYMLENGVPEDASEYLYAGKELPY